MNACVCMCMQRHTHTELCSLGTQKANFPLHSSVSHGLSRPLPHTLQGGWRTAACGSQIRGQSLSHREGRDYNDFEWQVGGIT